MKFLATAFLTSLAACALCQNFGAGRPVVTSASFKPWAEAYVASAIASCPLARQTSIFVSNSGNDGNPGTSELPIKTIAQVNRVLAENSNVAILFHAGEVFRAGQGIQIVSPDVTISSYRLPTDPVVTERPVLTMFQPPVARSSWAPDTALGVWTTQVASPVAWIHYYNDNLTVFICANSYTQCASTPGSFYQSGNTLYVHNFSNLSLASGDRQIEYVYKNQVEGIHTTDVDNIRVDDIILEGFGAGTAGDFSYNGYAIEGNQVGTHRIVVTDTETYFSGRHSITKVGVGVGGSMVVSNCRVGWLVNDNINMVGYSSQGGQEMIVTNTEFLGAQLPTGAQPYPYSGSGQTVYAHTGGGAGVTSAFFLCMDNQITPGQFQNDMMETDGVAPAYTDLANCAAFVIGTNAPARAQTIMDTTCPSSNGGNGLMYYLLGSNNTVYVNCTVAPTVMWLQVVGDVTALNSSAGTWINCTITFDFHYVPGTTSSDCRACTATNANMANFTSSFYNCQIRFICGQGSGNYGFSGTMLWNFGAQSLAQAWQGQLIHCSLECVGVGAGNFKVGWGNDGVSMIGNSYPGFAVVSGAWGMNLDPSPFITPPGALIPDTTVALTAPTIGGYMLQYDKLYRSRNTMSAVGAYEVGY